MEIYVMLSGKGGSGKTTLSVHLAVAAELSGKTVALIDLDPQGSAMAWGASRSAATPVVVSADAARLKAVLKTAASNGVEVAVIDTAPHTDADVSAETPASIAASVASLLIIPCRAAIFDLRAIAPTIRIASQAEVPAMAVLNAVPSRGKRAAEARTALESYNIPCAPCQIGDRVAFVHAVTAGLTAQELQPKSKAAAEVFSLYKYIQHHTGDNRNDEYNRFGNRTESDSERDTP
ncbi:AAA family ATPase [Candidatus Poribacteria bacterium]|nr:AAA family ATPase [Candidatus Poribacteria bacterium]MYB01736.1 AAA family ATPase [Candidatus Poribacteria bacterium]